MIQVYRFIPALIIVGLAAFMAACGSEPVVVGDEGAGELAGPTSSGAGVVSPTATPGSAGLSASFAGWRTDVASGPEVGQVAPNTSVLLRDGSTATLEEVAAGKPVLLYFFATW